MINAETQRREDAETEVKLAVHKAQVLTYLRLTGLKLGIVANFGQERLIEGWDRVVNNL
jgi:GxxExxY protein